MLLSEITFKAAKDLKMKNEGKEDQPEEEARKVRQLQKSIRQQFPNAAMLACYNVIKVFY